MVKYDFQTGFKVGVISLMLGHLIISLFITIDWKVELVAIIVYLLWIVFDKIIHIR